MVESSKILTVSYGTFSCTLEGFDDSFTTMKAIAEYFRDLAAEDRYFGAEPPTPDAETLARIAERQIEQRVDAQIEDGEITLRAGATAALTSDAPAMPPETQEPETPQAVAEDVSEEAQAQDTADNSDEMDIETSSVTSFDDMTPISGETPAAVDADSIAAKLQRIRAVVGKPDPADTPKPSNLTEAFDQPTEATDEDTSSEENEIAEIAARYTNDPVSRILGDDELIQQNDDLDKKLDEAIEQAEASNLVDADETDEVEAEAAETDEADASDDEVADEDVAEEEDNAGDEQVETADADEAPEEPAEEPKMPKVAEVETSDDDKKTTVRARILKVSRSKPVNLEEAVAEEQSNEVAEDLTSDLVAEDSSTTEPTLSPEEEAELQQELAEVEREAAEDRADGRHGRDILPENDDAAMSRIMDQANEQMSEPEGSRRRNAIAQLKAAVAATEAARQLGDNGNGAKATESEFRDDLDQVVRPRPASSLPRAEERTERPRPAPLKLVASQRVDESTSEPSEPVHPRRVEANASDEAPVANSFAEFAAEMGATELPDLLEAAAAYTAYVEGSEDFSRPQIMKKVQATSAEGFSREDSLRSFGTLLRQGRINKVRNGRFQVSEQTRFKPEQKAG